MACDVLLVAAFHPELAPLRPLLGEGLRGRLGGLDVAAAVVGIGATMAAAGTAMRLSELGPKRVVAMGTCGAYAEGGLAMGGLAVGDVAVARRVLLVAPSVIDGLAQFPEPMSVVSEAHPGLVGALVARGGKATDVAATLAITVDDAAAWRIARSTGAGAEHLEAHGMAVACAARGIPFGAAFGVANRVGSGAREEWRRNHRDAAASAAAIVTAWLTSGGA